MKKFTLEEIKSYILSQDSMGDIYYNLNEKNVDDANDRPKLIENLMEIREDWTKEDFYEVYEDWNDIDELSLDQMTERMEETLTHTYTTSYIAEVIRDEA